MKDFESFVGGSFDQNTGEFNLDMAYEEAIKSKDRVNILICGLTGVGKSTLINAFFGKDVAATDTDTAEPVTQHLERYNIPERGLCLWDTKGIEAKDYEGTIAQLKKDIDSELNNKEFPHVGWLLINAQGNRVQEADYALVKILEERGIPIVVVFTSVCFPAERKFVEMAKKGLDDKVGNHIDGAYVAVNSIPFELGEGEEPRPVTGLRELLDATIKKYPEGEENAKSALLKAQRVDNGRRLEEMKKAAKTVVNYGAGAAGVVGASPIPGSDAPLIAAAQSAMIYKINTEFELNMSDSLATATVTGILGVTAVAQVGKAIVANALKFIPGVGTLAGGAISSATAVALTQAVGHAYIATLSHFYNNETGEVELPGEASTLLRVFKDTFSFKP